VVDYFGNTVTQNVSDNGTELNGFVVSRDDVCAFKPVARVDGAARVRAALEGDGLSMRLVLELENRAPLNVELNPFAPLYKIAGVQLNGKPLPDHATLELKPGKHNVEVVYRSRSLRFSAREWAAVELLKEGKTNFCLVADPNPGFENGTAMQLNFFLQQYDEEDGVIGNLAPALIYHSEAAVPRDYTGWKVVLAVDPQNSGVFVEPEERRIRIVGTHPGDVRRQMMVFMRLVDRKYPHLGRNYPLRTDISAGWEADMKRITQGAYKPAATETWRRLLKNKSTAAFFEQFSDRDFWKKPLLEEEHEPLYADGNLNFEGKYQLRCSPWILEPTYSCDYVYGYGKNALTAVPPAP